MSGQAGKVNAIDKSSIHRICSGQVILDLATSVKEIVENSLDAGATSVEVRTPDNSRETIVFTTTQCTCTYVSLMQIRLKEYGSELIEVADNGSGIQPEDYSSVAAKYYTSKIKCFKDVEDVQSYGFRGEALSSLCAVAELSITTKTAEQGIGAKLTFDHHGGLAGARHDPEAASKSLRPHVRLRTLGCSSARCLWTVW
jgi:DNA mismatch repair protein PMS2